MTGGPLEAQVLRGIAWKVASQVILQGSRIVVALVLARLLAPHDYGIAGMVLVFSSLIAVFSDVALGAALVQRRHLTELDRSTVFWTSTAVGLAFTTIGILMSWPVAAFFGEPQVQPLLAAMSGSFVLTALGTTQKALLTRDLDFKRLELRLIGATLASAVLGVTAAALGAGAWAIIGQQIVLAFGSTLLLWVASPWRPRFRFSSRSLRSLLGFSAGVFGTRVLFYVSRNADNLLVGKYLGSAALGSYALAYNLMLMPMERLAAPVQEVLFPAFSRMQDTPRRLATAWLRVNKAIAALTIPVLLALIVVAPEFVAVALGEKWEPAVPVLQILAWAGLLQSLQRLNSSVLQARGRAGSLFLFSAVAAGTNLAGFVIGLEWGIVGVAAAYAITNTALQPIYMRLTAHTVGLGLRACVASLAGVLQASVVMLAAILGARSLLLHAGAGSAATLVATLAAGALVYLPVLAWRAPELRGELQTLARRRRAAATVPPAAALTP